MTLLAERYGQGRFQLVDNRVSDTESNQPTPIQPRRPIGEIIGDRETMREASRRAAEIAERRKALRQEPVKNPVR